MKTLRLCGSVFANQRYGGVSRYLVELAKGVAATADWNVQLDALLYSNAYLRDAAKALQHPGVHVNRRPRGLSQINHIACRLANSTVRTAPDIIHEGFFESGNLQKKSIPRVASFYDMISEKFMNDLSMRDAKLQTVQESDKLIAISESTKRDMVDLLSIDPQKIEVIYLATDMKRQSQRFPLDSNAPYILWVGNRNGYKNFKTFVEGFAMTRNVRADLQVVCAGGPPLQPHELEHWNQHRLNPDRMTHVQPSEQELAMLYGHAEMLIYVSKYEGFGIPPLEAMACGCPVIASDTSSIPEVTGDAAVLVDPTDSEAVAHSMERVWEDREYRGRLIEAGDHRVRLFTWDRCVEKHLELYSSLVA
ncbi:glycosyltransferase family 4 protein [Roseiconus nitratireducens]|uniref:glycosyltransferase family 4 protein n=1 Tax=Roseiconus nitratireducens TaxID=2605748 RepID=UPI0013760A47|nr:glycosyltransferase family 1 protein [Roseiconus nitratireducens]